MQFYWRALLRLGWIVVLTALVGSRPVVAQNLAYAAIGETTRPPIGWVEFCAEHESECNVGRSEPRTVALSPSLWRELVRINQRVNTDIKPMTDLEHWGVPDKWDLPDDGRGDCEDYQLLKRKRLAEAGLPRRAMRMTVVLDEQGDGHAVLMIRTDRGDLILDNKAQSIRPWYETGYVYIKRESQNGLGWVSLGGTMSPTITANP
jgi:predicted transglutaminase-like cysteine proteinase